jgi:DNA-binding PadR family transcriptional regulator
MTRLFGRGELKSAILDTLGDIEPANGYAIMQAMASAIGGGWRPSPGAVYPAVLGLEDAGLIEVAGEDSGSVSYRLTDAGRSVRAEAAGTVSAAADRARTSPPTRTLGALVDEFAAQVPDRSRKLTAASVTAVERALASTHQRLVKIVEKESNDG